MKFNLLFAILAAFMLVSPARSEILVFKNGQKIETNYRWKVSPDTIGFFYNGKEYHANKKDIDWAKTKQINKEKLTLEPEPVKATVSTEDFTTQVKKTLANEWEIRRVSLNNRSLRITTAIRSLDSASYNKMVTQICRDLKAYPGVAKKLKEIVFLSKWETQGWVFTSPVRFNEILNTPANELDTVIAKYTQRHTRD